LDRSPPQSLIIEAVNAIGTYGVNIAFSDGHARGIYPWPYLAALAERPQLEDFLTD
jgi:prepilin-type processing-associated H-X9-DG protein